MVELSDNSNLALFGKPNRKLFEEDMIHLRKGGSALLSSNIRYSVIKGLKINLSTRRDSQYRYDGRTSPQQRRNYRNEYNFLEICKFQQYSRGSPSSNRYQQGEHSNPQYQRQSRDRFIQLEDYRQKDY